MTKFKSILSALLISTAAVFGQAASAKPPNIVYILGDDNGYGDFPYSKTIDTPNIDALATQGTMLTSFLAEPICTPSRAALLLGQDPVRRGWGAALGPTSVTGIDPGPTIASKLREANYDTEAVGKWHLGRLPRFNPIYHGFDDFFGVLGGNNDNPLVLMRGIAPAAEKATQANLPGLLTDEAVKFIARHKTDPDPFFLYFASTESHVPFAPGCNYTCTVEGIDRSVGRVMAAIKAAGLDSNTLVIVTSDNGPALYEGRTTHGSCGPLSKAGVAPDFGGKRSNYECGIRVPFIARWPGHIPAGRRVAATGSVIDMYPTFAKLAGLTIKRPELFDGMDISPLLLGKGARTPIGPISATSAKPNEFLIYNTNRMRAFRSGKWKVHFNKDGKANQLYDLDLDLGETNNLASTQAGRLNTLAVRAHKLDNTIPRTYTQLKQ